MTIRGICEDCEKGYRLPAGGRTYTCKACGGNVRALDELELVPEVAPEPAQHGGEHHGSVLEHRRAIDARRRAVGRKRTLVWGAFLVVFAAGAVTYQVMRPKAVLAAGGVARDLDAGAGQLAQAWSAGDVEALVGFHHPDGRAEQRTELGRLAKSRGWDGGFPNAKVTAASLSEGTEAAPRKAVACLACGDEAFGVKFSLQYEPAHERWYVYHVDVAPPPLAPALERFREAWAKSSPEALAPLFPPDQRKKWTDLVERKARELAWSPSFPELGEGTTKGELELRRATERVPGLHVETVFGVPQGELRLRWLYRLESDAWFLAALTFPKGG